MNTEFVVSDESKDASKFNHGIQVDTALPVLFGERVPKTDRLATNLAKGSRAQVFANTKSSDATTPYEETVKGLMAASNFDKLKLKKGQNLMADSLEEISKFESATEKELGQYLGFIKGPVYHKQQYQVIKNEFFGIEKSYKVNVLWVNLERSWTWEALLPSKWSNTIAKDNAEKISKLKSKPEFYNLNYSTFNTNPNSSVVNIVDMTASQANMMAHLSAWVTKQLEPILLSMYSA